MSFELGKFFSKYLIPNKAHNNIGHIIVVTVEIPKKFFIVGTKRKIRDDNIEDKDKQMDVYVALCKIGNSLTLIGQIKDRGSTKLTDNNFIISILVLFLIRNGRISKNIIPKIVRHYIFFTIFVK